LNSINYEQAQVAYQAGNYIDALKSYYAALKDDHVTFGPGDLGLVYYRVGNCLLKMHSFNEAAISYKKALEDTIFAQRGATNVNLGKSLLGEGRFQEAIEAFNSALADPAYVKGYQAQMGLGNAYSKLGMIVEAGTAYRNAALDERNPNPSKALLSLGACFVALGRPADAIESYTAVFDFAPSVPLQQKTYENLGLAYAAAERYPEAVQAFNQALEPGGFVLSTPALAAYQKALVAIGAEPDLIAQAAGLGTMQDGSQIYRSSPALEPTARADGSVSYGAGNVPTTQDTGFFDAVESDLVKMSKDQIKGERKLRHTGLKITLGIVIFLVLLLGLGVFAFTQGYGYPTQEAVVQDLFDANADGRDPTPYWVGASTEEEQAIRRVMDMVAPTKTIEIVYLERAMTTSEVVVAARLQNGGTLNYDISLTRSGLGWKIDNLSLYFG
jgi:tetratricopeptide (TPR) repeat protein